MAFHISSLQEKNTFIYKDDGIHTQYKVPANKMEMFRRIHWENPITVLRNTIISIIVGVALCGGLYLLDMVFSKYGIMLLK